MRGIILLIFLKKGTFLYKGNAFKTKREESEEETKEQPEEKKLQKIKDDYKNVVKYIEDESVGINYDFFKDCFNFLVPTALAK